ncbi:hypothetical protein BH09PSE5_BH09PSE5_16040 [soil metagenome]
MAVALGMPLISLVTFVAYWRDKRAAQSGGWRTSEQALHMLAFIGGWPGAWLAQRLLRHKSSKHSFLSTFKLTVFAHGLVLIGWAFSGRLS